jgi:hypothetical protein
MSEKKTLRLIEGPLDGCTYPAGLDDQVMYAFDGLGFGGFASHYRRVDDRLMFAGLEIDTRYVAEGLEQISAFIAEQVAA